MRLGLLAVACLVAVLALVISVDLNVVTAWALEEQRAFQNQMAIAVRALKAGDPGAYAALFAATAAYGFVHAIGPGHGKYLLGGLGLGTSVSHARLVGIAAVSSVAQSLWAILLVYGGFTLISITAQQMTDLAEDVLAPASYVAIAFVGAFLVWTGARRFAKARSSGHHTHSHEHCCSAHGPTPDQVEALTSWRETVALIASVAIRPCTGAIFLLVIAWQMDIQLAGALAVIVMGLGTAGLTSLVAVSSVTARKIAFVTTANSATQTTVFSATQVFVGLAIIWFSLSLLSITP